LGARSTARCRRKLRVFAARSIGVEVKRQ
jgi:hypothetical protein